jgi:hypothetical protein
MKTVYREFPRKIFQIVASITGAIFTLCSTAVWGDNGVVVVQGRPTITQSALALGFEDATLTFGGPNNSRALALYTRLSQPPGGFVPSAAGEARFCLAGGCGGAPSPEAGGSPLGAMVSVWDGARFRWAVAGNNAALGSPRTVYFTSISEGLPFWSTPRAVLVPIAGYTYERPSVAVNSQGRIIVGANLQIAGQLYTDLGFWVAVSSDGGVSWSAPIQATPVGYGAQVIAAGDRFMVFGHQYPAGPSGAPAGVTRIESTDGFSWFGATTLMTYSQPRFFSPGVTSTFGGQFSIGFFPFLQAFGLPNGDWAVVWPAQYAGFNNLMTCTGTRGCGWINLGSAHQFLGSVSVSPSGGYWYSYYLLVGSDRLLRQQSLFFPSPSSGLPTIGADTVTGIESDSWSEWSAGTSICPFNSETEGRNCRLAGVFHRGDSNSMLAMASPYLQRSSLLAGTFAVDPPGRSNVRNFRPNFVAVPAGANLRSSSEVASQTAGVSPLCVPATELAKWLRRP